MALKSNLIAALGKVTDAQENTYQSGMKHARSKPLPPPNTYNCQLTDIDGNEYTDQKTGQECVNIEASFKVTDGDQAGFTFAHTFWGNSERDQGALLDLAACATGETPAGFKDAVTSLANAENAVVQVKIVERAVKGQPGVMRKYINFVA